MWMYVAGWFPSAGAFGGESEMRAGPSGATKDEDPNQVQNDDVGTERNKVIRGD